MKVFPRGPFKKYNNSIRNTIVRFLHRKDTINSGCLEQFSEEIWEKVNSKYGGNMGILDQNMGEIWEISGINVS